MGESRRLRNADKLPKPSQLAVDAIRTTAATMGRARTLQAAEEVERNGNAAFMLENLDVMRLSERFG